MDSNLALSPRTAVLDSPAENRLPLATTLSAPYSGSTLFAILLSRHPQLSSDGETFPQEEDRPVTCSCGKLQIDCPYYRQAAAHMLSTDGDRWDRTLFTTHPVYSRLALVDKAAGRLWSSAALHWAQSCLRSTVPSWKQQDRHFVAAHHRFMENSLRMRQARIYVDGCKSIRRALLFAGSGQFRMKVIHLVRDGRAFCFSYLKNRGLPRTQLPQAAHAWLKEINAVERFMACWPNIPVLGIRYEDLCHDLPHNLNRVCEFLDVPYEPALESSEAPTCHVLGNRMRLTFSGKTEECLRWRREFTPHEVDFLNRTLRATLDRYQYTI